MKSLLPIAAVLTASAIPALAKHRAHFKPSDKFDNFDKFSLKTQKPRAETCKLTDDLCVTCDGGNVTDTGGQDWAVSCGWSISSEDEDPVEGDTSPQICIEACDDDDDCWAVNLAANGSCTLVTGDPKGLSRRPGTTSLVRLAGSDDEPDVTSTSTSRVKITATIYGPGATPPAQVSITSTTSAAPAASSSATCDLRLTNLCPRCDGRQVETEDGSAYKISCESDLYSNSSYSPQEWMSPGECLTECDKFEWCKGTVYYDDRSCELARGEDVFPTSKADYTAFLPVSTEVAAAAKTSPSAFPTIFPANYTKPSSTGEPTFSILPISSGCDLEAPTCPQCDGFPYVDKLHGSYTVMCGVEPDCVSTSVFREEAENVEYCIQSCDQDATCLGLKWFPEYNACHLCRQGVELDNRTSEQLTYVLLVADIDGDDDDGTTTTSTTTHRTTVNPTHTLVPPVTRSITDLPRPFTTNSVNAVGPVGPVIPSSIASATRINPGGSIINVTSAKSTASVIHLTSSSLPPTITNIAAVSCPASNHSVYVVPDSGNYFAVACDNMFTAAHSQYTTATDFAACAASCTAQCDGIQFGYETRCGLYTDISIIGSAAGWTVAASITFPIPASTAAVTLATSSQRRYSNSTAA
ncbi:hypothetical protein M409DRAFT_18958 [Zasmidium cellare ATCC 36951]|uniref:Apple domain-containing protein n=1 Tax=Zasmidium cellare ATCC 36951 TaxID=1080233 RepID=A0A6A6D025_ZASCE|nr:uncharacterized protein M409DRAFT_18958 [Zasmidium cellare ATCC 36951]KAF2170986.1 hypothetical protein M409DRAFT_18958 [Zasmidium cellare ATCC 36951]